MVLPVPLMSLRSGDSTKYILMSLHTSPLRVA
jgi:hypothetical protein